MFFTIIPNDPQHIHSDSFIREKLTTVLQPLSGMKHNGLGQLLNKCTVNLFFSNRKLAWHSDLPMHVVLIKRERQTMVSLAAGAAPLPEAGNCVKQMSVWWWLLMELIWWFIYGLDRHPQKLCVFEKEIQVFDLEWKPLGSVSPA